MFPLPQRGHLWKTVWAPELPGGLAVASAAFAVHSRSAPSGFVHALPVLLLRVVASNFLSANPYQSLRPEYPTQDSATCRTLKFLPTGPAEITNTGVRHSCMHTYFLLLEDLPHVKYWDLLQSFLKRVFSSWNEALLLTKSQTYNLWAAVRFFDCLLPISVSWQGTFCQVY